LNQVDAGPPKSVFARFLNRLGMPLGILPFPFAYEAPLDASGRERMFEGIYKTNSWGSAESRSGTGSELRRSERYRHALLHFLREQKIGSMFDAPCGDLNWMRLVLDDYPMRYVGGDIADSALALARQNRPGVQVLKFDICRDPFPDCELWHCRDALFHLSFADARLALRNAARSNARLALMTTHHSRWLKNVDIRTGGWRHLDLERPPLSLPKPIAYLPDTGPREFPRFVGVWAMNALRTIFD